jgi:aspartyl-tRNA(Asn)/glutamyl-tRNA(Gln) amidotransferase subunit B
MVNAVSEFEYLPADLRQMLARAGIAAQAAEVLVGEPELARVWYGAHELDPKYSRFVFTWLTGPEIKLREERGSESKLTAKMLNEVGGMVEGGKLSSTNAKELLTILRMKAGDPASIAKEKGLIQESDEGELGKVVDEVIADNAKAVADYQSGNQRAFGALVGAAMKATKGKGNPPLITKLLKDRLS